MKLKLSLLLLIIPATHSVASPKIIYGEDNRIDTYATPSSLFKRLASSSAAQIDEKNIRVRGNSAELIGDPLGEVFRLCKKERFYHQPFIADCSGVLVGPDLIVSAGHCYEEKNKCRKYRWVFDYKVDSSHQTAVTVDVDDVYKCKEMVSMKYEDGFDYAVIRLDRPVKGRTPVKLGGKITPGTSVVMIGHPSGLPQKIADSGIIKSISKTEFKATVDAFQINSGSGVFNSKTGELLGVLVRGQVDYRGNENQFCNEVNVTTDEGTGEDIASLVQFEAFLK